MSPGLCSGISITTGLVVEGSNSDDWASFKFKTLRANSITATCIPRHTPEGQWIELRGCVGLPRGEIHLLPHHSPTITPSLTQVRDLMVPCIVGCQYHPLGSPGPKSPRHENPVCPTHIGPGLMVHGGVCLLHLLLQRVSLHTLQVQCIATGQGRVLQGLDDGDVGIGELGVLAHQSNRHFLGGIVVAVVPGEKGAGSEER